MYIIVRTRDDNDVHFVLDPQTLLDIYNASSKKQPPTYFLTKSQVSQSVSTLAPECSVTKGIAANSNFIINDLSLKWSTLTISPPR